MFGVQRIAALTPRFEAALERPDALDAVFSEEERHTGARGFVGSSTVENDFAIAGKAIVFLFQLLGIHSKCAGDDFGLGFEIHGMPQVDDDELLAVIDFSLQFLHGDARDAQFAKEALPGEIFIADVPCESAQDQEQQPTAKMLQAFRDAFDLAAKCETQAKEGACPQDGTHGVVEKETVHAHVKDAGERRCDGAQAGKKFSKEQRTCTSFGESAFGAADTGIRLHRNFAEKLKNSYASAAAEVIPDEIRSDGSEHYIH